MSSTIDKASDKSVPYLVRPHTAVLTRGFDPRTWSTPGSATTWCASPSASRTGATC